MVGVKPCVTYESHHPKVWKNSMDFYEMVIQDLIYNPENSADTIATLHINKDMMMACVNY